MSNKASPPTPNQPGKRESVPNSTELDQVVSDTVRVHGPNMDAEVQRSPPEPNATASKLQRIRQALESNPALVVVGVIETRRDDLANMGGGWHHHVEFFVARAMTGSPTASLKELVDWLRSEVEPDMMDAVLGKSTQFRLYFDEVFGYEWNEQQVLLRGEEPIPQGWSSRERRVVRHHDLMRRTWVWLYPDEATARLAHQEAPPHDLTHRPHAKG